MWTMKHAQRSIRLSIVSMARSPASSLHKSRSSSLFSFLSTHPSYISFHNRLPTHPSPPSAPQNHVSIFLTCIHRVRSDHSYKSQVLSSLPSSVPDLTQRGRPPIAVPSRRETGHSTPSTHDRGGAVEQCAVSVGLVRLYLLTQIIADDAPMRLAHGARSCVQPPPAVCPWSHLDARARGSAGDDHVSQARAQAQT